MHLGYENKKKVFFCFALRSVFTLSSTKIGCTSAMKTKKSVFLFCIALGFHYL